MNKQEQLAEQIAEKLCIIVWKNGNYKLVEANSSWEFENDKDWLVSIPLDSVLVEAMGAQQEDCQWCNGKGWIINEDHPLFPSKQQKIDCQHCDATGKAPAKKGAWVKATDEWPNKKGSFTIQYYSNGKMDSYYVSEATDKVKETWDYHAKSFQWWNPAAPAKAVEAMPDEQKRNTSVVKTFLTAAISGSDPQTEIHKAALVLKEHFFTTKNDDAWKDAWERYPEHTDLHDAMRKIQVERNLNQSKNNNDEQKSF